MCGFLYYKNFKNQITPDKREKLKILSKRMNHRGPDNHMIYCKKNTFISFFRLSIINPGPEANQPLHDDKSVMAFNGMIYNFKQLSKKYNLKKLNTSSDTEVLFQLINIHGEKIFKELDGMASIVYESNQSIFLFRDLFGQKPLYYFYDKKELIACSDLKVIKKILNNGTSLNSNKINLFLSLSYLPGKETIYRNIFKVLPGQLIKISKNKIEKKIIDAARNYQSQKIFTIDDQFIKSSELVSYSDVKSSILLSGGVDSALSYYYLKQKIDIEPYYLSVDDKNINEDHKIIKLEKFFNHKINTIKFQEKDFIANLIELTNKIDEPHGDIGTLTSYFLMKQIDKSNKVVFSGDGADELFCGYETFKALLIPNFFEYFFKNAFLKKLFKINDQNYMSFGFKLNQYIKGLNYKNTIKFFKWTSGNFENYSGDIISKLNLTNYQGKSEVDNLRYFYLEHFLPNYICGHTDKSSMLNSLELRSIYLNKSFLSFSNKLKANMMLKNFNTKIILKKHAQDLGLPDTIYNQKKIGFTLPVAKWLSKNKGFLHDFIITDNEIMNHVDNKIIKKIFHDFINKNINNYREIYNILVLGLYLNEN